MDASWTWWLIGLVLVIAEMASGTFYLIAVAFGLMVAGLGAHLGWSLNVQLWIAAVLCTGCVAAIYQWNKRHARPRAQVNFSNDIGQSVRIVAWSAERVARVSYRGAEWDAQLTDKGVVDPARLVWKIVEISGNRLIIE